MYKNLLKYQIYQILKILNLEKIYLKLYKYKKTIGGQYEGPPFVQR